MTAEQRTVIDLSDIAALEITCPHCDSRVRYALAKIDSNRIKANMSPCPNCKEHVLPLGGPEVNALADFVDNLRSLTRNKSKAVRLEISGCTQ
jgi:DNA-directed RNA polymerase subunit RPC12/RpoP